MGTLRMSVVAAYPRMMSCRIGAPTTRPKSRGSRRSSINSLRTSTSRRRIWSRPPLAAEPHRCEHQKGRRECAERRQLAPDDRPSDALQHHAAKDDEEIAGGDEVGHAAKEGRHALDRKDEA